MAVNRGPIARFRYITFTTYNDGLRFFKALQMTTDTVRQGRKAVSWELLPVTSGDDFAKALSKPGADLILVSAHGNAVDRPWLGPSASPARAVFLDEISVSVDTAALLVDACYAGTNQIARHFARIVADAAQPTAYVASPEYIHSRHSIVLWPNLLIALVGMKGPRISADAVVAAAEGARSAARELLGCNPSGQVSLESWPDFRIICDLAQSLPALQEDT